jgi:PRC-barrel domain
MIHPADIREWRHSDVIDPEGKKIGALEGIYVDTVTDMPSVATIRTGLRSRQRLVFVPVDEATLGPGYVQVAYSKGQVKKAPSIDTDGVLPVGREEEIFMHYDRPYEPGADRGRRLARR